MPDMHDMPDTTKAPGPRGGAAARTGAPAPDDVAIEAPEADVAEQRTTVLEEEDESGALVWAPVPDGVDPADRTDQQRVVTRDEDEYR